MGRRIARWVWPPRIPITALGWTVLVVAVVSWWSGVQLGWDELLILAACCLIAVAVGLLWVIRAPRGSATIVAHPDRVVVGGDAVGEVGLHNTSSRRMSFGQVAVPVDTEEASFPVPGLAADESWSEAFVLPTGRRRVVSLGPPRVVRADPLGMARREIVGDSTATLYVHPTTVRLPPIASGLLRDLDGTTTNDLSNSDVAFHTLREYVPGDELRQVHWRTTARLGTLMVRQFVDTRRARLGLVLSTSIDEWTDDEEFEMGISVLASIGRTALAEQHPVTTTIGGDTIPSGDSTSFLDGLAGVEFGGSDDSLATVAAHATVLNRDASLVALITGAAATAADLRRVAQRFGPSVRVLALRCDQSSPESRNVYDHVSVVGVRSLDTFSNTVARGVFG
ncbi:MAG: DUF58 domain-containing protein [Actinomycetota bacterium]